MSWYRLDPRWFGEVPKCIEHRHKDDERCCKVPWEWLEDDCGCIKHERREHKCDDWDDDCRKHEHMKHERKEDGHKRHERHREPDGPDETKCWDRKRRKHDCWCFWCCVPAKHHRPCSWPWE